jgi:competence protein ComGC
MIIWQFYIDYSNFTFTLIILEIITRYIEIMLLINVPKIAMDNSHRVESSS